MEKSLSQKIVEKVNERLNIVPSVLLYDELVGVVASELRAAQHRMHLTAFGVVLLAILAGVGVYWLVFIR
jgi:hypothetical protein